MRFDGKNHAQRASAFKLNELSGVTTPAHNGATVTIFKSADVTYAYNPKDGEPKLPIDDAAHVGAAIAALGPKGFRGNRVEIPEADRAGVIARVRAAWRKFHPDLDDDEMPETIRKFGDVFKGVFNDELTRVIREKNVRLLTQPIWDTIWTDAQIIIPSLRD